MARFFGLRDWIGEADAYLLGTDAAHITRVLRLGPGDEITLCDGEGYDYLCEIRSATALRVELAVLSKERCLSEPQLKVTLFQAIPKSDKLEFIIQKSVELGAFAVTPFFSSRCVVRLDKESAEKKTERWQRVAYEAAKQCGRGIVPQVSAPVSFDDMLAAAALSELGIFCYEDEHEATLKQTLGTGRYESISIIIGSEGGFSPEEAESARAAGLVSVSLGRRILRCETAPVCALSAVMYQLDQL